MNYHHLLFGAHLSILFTLSVLTGARLFRGPLAQVAAVALLIWANLVYTALIISAFSQLGNVLLYFGCSVTLTLLVWRLAVRCAAKPISLVTAPVGPLFQTWTQRLLGFVLIGSAGIAMLCTLIISIRYQANNWDSLAYRLPRALLYLGQGNIMHFARASDWRALTYPFNLSLGYLFLALYQMDALVFTFLSVVFWAMAGIGVFFLARVIGSSVFASLVAAWLACMAPIVLCEGASTNDDVIVAVPILLGLAFAICFARCLHRRCLVFAGIGFGLGTGARLHWVFFVPAIATAVLALVLYTPFRRRIAGNCRPLGRNLTSVLIAGAVALPLGATFLVANYSAIGAFTAPTLLSAQNKPFRVDVAVQEIGIISTQLFLNFLPDTQIHLDVEARQRTYKRFNDWFNQRWFRAVNQDPAFSVYGYRFQGVADPTGYWYFEQTLWLGMLPILMLAMLAVGAIRRIIPPGCLIFAAAFFAWHLTFAAGTKYMETAGAYYSYPAVLTCAGLGLAYDALLWRKGILHKVMLVCFWVVVAANVLIDFNLLVYNARRNVPAAIRREFDGETPVSIIAGPAIRAIQGASSIYIPYSHWEVLYWNFMRHNLQARYSTGPLRLVADPGTLTIISVEADGQQLIGRLPIPAPSGLTYLGESWSGYIFGRGSGTERQNPGSNQYFLISSQVSRNKETRSIERLVLDTNSIQGLEESRSAELRILLESRHGQRWVSPWLRPGSGVRTFAAPSDAAWVEMTVEARAAPDGDSAYDVVQTKRPFSETLLKTRTFGDIQIEPANTRAGQNGPRGLK